MLSIYINYELKYNVKSGFLDNASVVSNPEFKYCPLDIKVSTEPEGSLKDLIGWE